MYFLICDSVIISHGKSIEQLSKVLADTCERLLCAAYTVTVFGKGYAEILNFSTNMKIRERVQIIIDSFRGKYDTVWFSCSTSEHWLRIQEYTL